MVYIRQSQLPRLKEYKYSGVDHSLISRYILKPFYTKFVINCFPMWMAPNVITLSGFSFVVINFLTLLWYCPTLDQNCPPWVYGSWAIGLFLYQTFDAIDGTQARRTRQGGPLGELFDHGVDALNTVLEVLLFAAAMNLGQGWKTVATLFASLLTFYVQTWDEYHTHTLTLGLISGPVEGILTLCIVYAITASFGGGSFWQQSMLGSLGIEHHAFIPDILYDLAWNEWYMVYGGVVLVFSTVSSAINVTNELRKRGQSPAPALVQLLPFFGRWVVIIAYLYLQPVILKGHLIPFVMFVGLLHAYSVGQMIVAHMLKSEFPFENVITWPLIAGVFDSLGPWLQLHTGFGWPSALGNNVYQVAFVFLSLGLGIGVYGSFAMDVIITICDYLDIWCLTIKHPYCEIGESKKLY
ncbi:sn-1,2-diacylglycerol cholinephosphotransferas-like protein [Viridothelium virens]|uniref:diacylglycerol cholinephosphotransferase n=1 Tax=Viridothelium virens TaxID=1048519 RepID=A0A6A6HB51_VIRVR|nr:sn-1,2-diacylglycerol cholinephosphotransferas-like protein [Viridothelium virens]